MSDKTEVHIKPAKGRPMLTWVGKRALRNVIAYPAQLVETYQAAPDIVGPQPNIWRDWPAGYPQGGLLFHGDNKEVLAHLLANGFRGKVKLIYIDPPFDSGADYVRKITLRGISGIAKIDTEGYVLGEQIQYSDIWASDNYLQFMYERLLLLKELLSEDGSIYLHSDAHRCHNLHSLLDEIFGADCFRNQISWKRTSAHGGANRFGYVTDFILFYGKDPNLSTWNPLFQEITQEHKERHYRYTDERGLYALGELTAPGITHGPSGQPWRGFNVQSLGRHWANVPTELERLNSEGKIYWPQKKGGWPRLKRYYAEHKGRPGTDFWDDIDPINMVGLEREDYPTQKPEALIDRIIHASSNPGDLVLDCFIGSGTTAAVAQKLGRHWIGCDINKGAVQTTSKRLQAILQEQAAALQEQAPKNLSFLPSDTSLEDDQPTPAQLSFAVYRVNDYDLQIQHNEAVNLACEHIGITRTKTDTFFEGALGKRLVKIIPFNHPLTPLDLEEVKKELSSRPEESRDIVVVCLGKELAVEAWLEDWNRLRKSGDFPNKIEVIELRSDTRYGGFFTHQPAQAQVDIQRTEKGIEVNIETFISPTIIERLKQQAGLLSPQIEDWRAMVDSVMIDAAYDGEVFNVVLADVPEKKCDLVSGKYVLDVPDGETTVAVKITDMLGEEVMVAQKV
jgi:adenine-specific DNA-methyltransferase